METKLVAISDRPERVIRPFVDVADTLQDATGVAAARAQSWIAAQTGAARLADVQIGLAFNWERHTYEGYTEYRYMCVVTVTANLYGSEQMTPEDHARSNHPMSRTIVAGPQTVYPPIILNPGMVR